jgi:hypothetical protein
MLALRHRQLPPLALVALLVLPASHALMAQSDATLQRGANRLARAQPQAPPPQAPAPCANDAERHRFDFWIGEWDVTTPAGSPVGASRIEGVSGGCAVLESWMGARGGTGRSLTTFNPVARQWQQYWIGQDGQPHEYREGSWQGTSLVLRAHFAAADTVPAHELRLTFTPLDSATVRQLGERSSDGGATWTTTYDFLYHRRR